MILSPRSSKKSGHISLKKQMLNKLQNKNKKLNSIVLLLTNRISIRLFIGFVLNCATNNESI